MSISQKWRLDDLYIPKNWQSSLELFLKELTASNDLVKSINDFQNLHADFRQFSSYANCLFSENIENPTASKLLAESLEFETELQKAGILLDKKLLETKDFDAFVSHESLAPIAFLLKLRHSTAKQKMNEDMESLASDLALHGYHSWSELYKKTISGLTINLDSAVQDAKAMQDLESESLLAGAEHSQKVKAAPTKSDYGSRGCVDLASSTAESRFNGVSYNQIENLLSNQSREVRKEAFIGLENACKQYENVFAEALKAIFGFRLALYKKRGWESPIHEALTNNYMQQRTLDVMWKNVKSAAPVFHNFLDQKAKIFGLKKLSWYDFEAPFPGVNSKFDYQSSCSLLVDIFTEANIDIGSFAKKCLSSGWVEAEDRPKKAPGGFCTPFPRSNESRVYMNYSNTMNNFLVLAHELGHAYHDHVCFSLPELAQHYPSSVAETASTTCELIALDGLIRNAKNIQERKWLYYEKAHRSTTFFLNIHARFLFEQELFAHAQYCDAKQLSEMMVAAQKKAYGDRLETYHPYFWVTKLHFYLTDIPSYNFPYTFGYLLSLAINARMKREPEWFKNSYNGFLQDTGRMSVEELVQVHFGQDVQQDQFWQDAIKNALSDVEEFLAL